MARRETLNGNYLISEKSGFWCAFSGINVLKSTSLMTLMTFMTNRPTPSDRGVHVLPSHPWMPDMPVLALNDAK